MTRLQSLLNWVVGSDLCELQCSKCFPQNVDPEGMKSFAPKPRLLLVLRVSRMTDITLRMMSCRFRLFYPSASCQTFQQSKLAFAFEVRSTDGSTLKSYAPRFSGFPRRVDPHSKNSPG
eukprot:5415354-Pyramimonas_sp.AAC.1